MARRQQFLSLPEQELFQVHVISEVLLLIGKRNIWHRFTSLIFLCLSCIMVAGGVDDADCDFEWRAV